MFYSSIGDPKDNTNYTIDSIKGIQILKKYIKYLKKNHVSDGKIIITGFFQQYVKNILPKMINYRGEIKDEFKETLVPICNNLAEVIGDILGMNFPGKNVSIIFNDNYEIIINANEISTPELFNFFSKKSVNLKGIRLKKYLVNM